MPVEMNWNGTYSVSRSRRATLIATGLDAPAGVGEVVVWLGYKTVAGAPTTPNGLEASRVTFRPTSFGTGQVVTVSLAPGGTGRVVVQAPVGGGDMEGIAAGAYVWAGVTETDDPTENFLALAGPKRAAY